MQSLDHPRGKIESVECGHMITVLYGKTIGSTFMAGCVDNIRKEANMTPKQFFDLGDSVIQDLGFWKKGFTAVGEDGKVMTSTQKSSVQLRFITSKLISMTPGMPPVIISPCFTGPTPEGVPVRIMSPSSKVKY